MSHIGVIALGNMGLLATRNPLKEILPLIIVGGIVGLAPSCPSA